MRILNTFSKIENCYKNNGFDLDAWRRYTEEISSELSEKCELDAKEYDFDRDVFPIVNNVVSHPAAALLASTSFTSVTTQLNRNIHKLFESDIDLDIILYLGLCNGAGWATTLDGREASMRALIFHEIGHIWHKTHGILHPQTQSKGEGSLVQLYQEGIAMVCEQILCQDNAYYHQDKNGWLTWCTDNKAEISQEYLKRIENNISTQDFFGDWCSYNGYSDVGYYLGCEFVKYLQRQYSLLAIANFTIPQLFKQYKAWVE